MEGRVTLSAAPSLEIVEYRLRFPRPMSPREATFLRGYFGQAFVEEVLLHHHNPDGTLRYAYPRVQFKVLDHTAHLIGLDAGGELVKRLWAEVDQARIGAEELCVLEAGLSRRREPFGENSERIVYRFRTPWLGLNQNNYHLHESSTDAGQRRALLERVLVGNCLALAKAFGHRVGTRLEADASGLRAWNTRLKGVPMLGFLGKFQINFLLPDLIGIGKSVSRGFGTVERVRK